MGRYFVRGTDPWGTRRIERVTADTPAAALDSLASLGWRDLQLVTDSIFAEMATPAAMATRPRVEATYTPEEQLGFSRYGLPWQVWMALKKGGWIVVVAFGLWLLRRAMGSPSTVWDVLALVLSLGLVATWSVGVWSGGRYRRTVLAGYAGRWEEALRRVAKLERSSIAKYIPPSDFAFRRATALLALGREAEAMAVVERADRTGTPEWAFHARTADLHVRRRDAASALACLERAVAAGAEHADSYLSLAETQAGDLMRDPAAARETLARARTLPIASRSEWAVERIEAMIAVEEGRFEDALPHLSRARSAYLQIADRTTSCMLLAHLGAYAAIALGGLGRRDEARRALTVGEVERWLRPHAPELVDRALAAAG